MSRRLEDVNGTVSAWFQVFKWLLTIVFVGTVGVVSFMQGVQSESKTLKMELEVERNINITQDIKINETYEIMRNIASEQARIAQSMENISQTMIHTMQRVASDTKEIRMRVDRHIENSRD